MAMKTLDEETTKKVIRQLEFYFGNSNLATDSFLLKTIEEGEDGMVSLALICSFSRMKGHLGLGNLKADEIPEDTVKAVAEVMRNSEVVKISDDGMNIGRKAKLPEPEELIEQLDTMTLAASPLPYDAKLEEVESFFSQFAKVNSVRLPSHVSNKKLFSGTALVEFSSEEDIQKITGQNVEYAGVALEFRPKKEFDVEREAQEVEFANSQTGSHKKSTPEVRYPQGLIVAFKLKPKSSSDDSPKVKLEDDTSKEKEQEGTTPTSDDSKVNASDDTETKDVEEDKKPSEDANEKDKNYSYESCKDDMNIVTREDLKTVFRKYGIKYIDYKMGDKSGYLRFEEEEGAQKARAAAVLCEENGFLVKNFIATLEPVTGDAEKEYWKQIGRTQGNNRFRDNRGFRGRGGKNHRGGWKHDGRSRDNESGGRPNKYQKVAA